MINDFDSFRTAHRDIVSFEFTVALVASIGMGIMLWLLVAFLIWGLYH